MPLNEKFTKRIYIRFTPRLVMKQEGRGGDTRWALLVYMPPYVFSPE